MFAITGGGTGGHLAIAKALAEEITLQGHKAIYIGSNIGQDKIWFEHSPLFEQRYFLDSTGVVNKKGIDKIFAINKQIKAAWVCRKILKKHQVKCVISVGGFSAGGASMGAILCQIPLFIHEQNAVKGKLNEILTPFAKAIFGSFQNSSKNFIHTSYPVRQEFFSHSRVRTEIKHLLFLGGSQGAKAINDFAIQIAQEILNRGIKITHQCGTRDYERTKHAYEMLGILDKIDLFAFDNHLVTRLASADICIARAGASSLWEMSANGVIGVFIPYPYAAKDHQYYNALAFTQEGLGILMRESQIDAQKVYEFLEFLQQDGNLAQKSQLLIDKITPNGAKEIVQHITSLVPYFSH